ncbi:uncharacterized protein LOC129716628 [Wyeomyia smithii]|uniref:uncharacterized protein LOC129716628 n=1 Tax=Wyeomyia smithii TaxID=174621 RepID=UPI002467EC57|nr:uncharacterized protein LOC129716628 [Wyeomyia smithii]
MGGMELQGVFYGIPGVNATDDCDPYEKAKTKLNEHFSPKQHDCFERFQFWTMSLDKDEPLENFLLRIQQKAEKCTFGTNELECRQNAIIDKVIQNAPEDLRRKLLEKQQLTLDNVTKMVNAFQSIKQQASQMAPNRSNIHTEVNRTIVRKNNFPFYKDTGIPAFKARCHCCGRLKHREGEICPAEDKTCHRCRRTGHFRTMCKTHLEREPERRQERQKRRHSPARAGSGYQPNYSKRYRNVRNVEVHAGDVVKEEELPVYKISDDGDEYVTCRVGGVEIEMLIDSGSTYNLIDDSTWELLKLRDVDLHSQRFDSSKRFLAYGKVPLKLLTVFDTVLEIDDGAKTISTTTTFYVIERGQQPLLGKLTTRKLGLLRIGLPSALQEDVNRVAEVKIFPKIKDFHLVLPIDRGVPPVIQPLRRCPIPILSQVKAKLNELLAMGIIERVMKPTSWVSPLVPTMKDNELAEESRDITTFVTNWGLFRYTRLLFGVNYAPQFFQHLMESILSDCRNTVVFINDILIWGAFEAEHDEAVKKTLSVLASHGLSLNINKCKFKKQQIEFLGHNSSPDGVLPSEAKITAMSSTTKQGGTTQFPGPLSNQFQWHPDHEKSFEALKRQLGHVDHLGYYDPKDYTILVTDASGVGLGAVLVQIKNHQTRIISYASRSLSETERRYPPIEKEALAIVWGVLI